MKKRKYYKVLFIYIGVLVFVGVVLLSILWNFLKNYQVSMPTSVMNDIIQNIDESNANEEFVKYISNNLNEFENQEQLTDYFKDVVKEKDLSYSLVSGESSDDIKTYYIKADQDKILKVTLEFIKDGAGFGFDSWEIKNLGPAEGITEIEVPSGAEVFINGKQLTKNYISKVDNEITLLENIYENQWVNDLPLLTEYKVEGFFTSPDVSVKVNGEEVLLEKNDNGVYEYPFLGTEEFAQVNEPWIIDISEIYGEYITKDIDFGVLANHLIGGSKLYEDIRTLEIRWYQEHESYVFDNQKVTDYKIYSENCFSCNVYFEQTVFSSGVPNLYKTSLNWIFVKINGNWKLADMNINVTE